MLVAHLDADCFYVSAERVRDSFLVGKPVGVLGNQGACVIAKSYEMKAAGVKTGEPIWDAVKKCPEGIYIKRDFRWYEVLSRKMLDAVREESPRVEYYSVDEFFMTVEDSDPQRFAERVRDRINETLRLPVTIGVARTRTLAKLVSDLAKPFGALALVGREKEEAFLAKLPVGEVTGIGHQRAAKLASYGIRTCLDFARADTRLIRRLLTIVGEQLCLELRGDRVISIQPQRPPHKLISRGGSIGQATDDPTLQWAWAIRNLERLIEALEQHGLQAGRLTLHLDYKDAPPSGAETRLESPTDQYDLLVGALRSIWAAAMPRGRMQRMHLFADELQYPGPRQLGLFDPPPTRDRLLRAVKRDAAATCGRFAVRSAATLPLAEIYLDDAHSYEICDIAGKTCF